MRRKADKQPNDSDWLSLEEKLLDLLKITFIGNEGQAERVMRLLHRLVKELENGSKERIGTSLNNAQRLAFCHTQFHRDCWRFYRDVVLELPEPEANELISQITEIMRQRARLRWNA